MEKYDDQEGNTSRGGRPSAPPGSTVPERNTSGGFAVGNEGWVFAGPAGGARRRGVEADALQHAFER